MLVPFGRLGVEAPVWLAPGTVQISTRDGAALMMYRTALVSSLTLPAVMSSTGRLAAETASRSEIGAEASVSRPVRW